MQTLADHATLVDSLGRVNLVTRLANAVMNCAPPRVYGVHGDWGSGKTSFLHQLHYALDGAMARKEWAESQVAAAKEKPLQKGCGWPERINAKDEDAVVLWFEAWRYQHEPAPVVALLHEMRGQLSLLVRATNWGKKIAEVTIRSGLLGLEQIAKFAWLQSATGITVANKGAGIVATVQDQGERWEREHLAENLPAETIREQLEHAVGQLLGRGHGDVGTARRRVVILIDDLDRCEPQATYRLLEGIKIYLNIPNCVFVLGMDQRIIEDAVAESAPGSKDDTEVANRRAREYLEKLFQEVYHLPIVLDRPDRLLDWLPVDEGVVTTQMRTELSALLAAYPECLPANPRKLKAFAAVIWRLLSECPAESKMNGEFNRIPEHNETAAEHRFLALIVILASLYHYHPDIYRILEAHTDDFYPDLYRWCANDDPGPRGVHACLKNLSREGGPIGPAEPGANQLPEWRSQLPDPSRGNVLRVQKMIYHARPYKGEAVRALLLR